MMTWLLHGSPLSIAFWRGVTLSLLTGAGTGLSTFGTSHDAQTALVAGLSALVLALTIRAGGEGYADRNTKK